MRRNWATIDVTNSLGDRCDRSVEKAPGNRDYFLNKPYGVG